MTETINNIDITGVKEVLSGKRILVVESLVTRELLSSLFGQVQCNLSLLDTSQQLARRQKADAIDDQLQSKQFDLLIIHISSYDEETIFLKFCNQYPDAKIVLLAPIFLNETTETMYSEGGTLWQLAQTGQVSMFQKTYEFYYSESSEVSKLYEAIILQMKKK